VTFTILDNEGDDRAVAIAKELGCAVGSLHTNGKLDDVVLRNLKNEVATRAARGWVIVADMDEWLCITAEDLAREGRAGTSILHTFGLNVFGTSGSSTLNDINLHALTSGSHHPPESKAICFRRPQISAMNYNPGAHKCAPVGDVRWSKRTYVLKHMAWLGRPFIVEKYQKRYARGKEQQVRGLGTHYTDDAAKVSAQYDQQQLAARPFSEASRRTPPSWPPALVRLAKRLRRVPAGVQRRVRRLIG
jgi:hypothetical protein